MLLEYLSKSLLLTSDFIEKVSETASIRYRKTTVPKPTGGTRNLYQPSRELKALQRVLFDDFISRLPVHPSAMAYLKGSSIKHNAEAHLGNKFLLRLDFKNFFESIKASDITAFINDNSSFLSPEWTADDTDFLTKVVCYENRLTIGSVTSPSLSNAICYKMDELIADYCQAREIKYTRYADDLFFSCSKDNELFLLPKQVKSIVRGIDYPHALWLNLNKTKHSSKKTRMTVTGLTLTNENKISIGRSKKRKIKSHVYKWEVLSPKEKTYLSGYIAYCQAVEPDFINKLCNKYGAELISTIQKYNIE